VLIPFIERLIDEFCRVSNESEHFSAIKQVSICERVEEWYSVVTNLYGRDEIELWSRFRGDT